jgi:hypothetical protein
MHHLRKKPFLYKFFGTKSITGLDAAIVEPALPLGAAAVGKTVWHYRFAGAHRRQFLRQRSWRP